MNDASSIHMSVDLKKHRIRFFKSALHQIGDPTYIQLLVNPANMAVAIKAVDYHFSGEHTHKVDPFKNNRDVTIGSKAFTGKLMQVSDELLEGHTYRLSGYVVPSERMIVFSLKTFTDVEI